MPRIACRAREVWCAIHREGLLCKSRSVTTKHFGPSSITREAVLDAHGTSHTVRSYAHDAQLCNLTKHSAATSTATF